MRGYETLSALVTATNSVDNLKDVVPLLSKTMSPIYTELIKGAFILGAVALGAWISVWMYFKQKEYELVKQRYLEGAIDVVIAEVEHASDVVSHNWARCLHLVKAYRDQDTDFDASELSKGFLEFDSSKFHQVAHYRIQWLIGSQLIWNVFQLVMARAEIKNNVITKEIPDAIKLRLATERIQATHAEFVDASFQELNKYGPSIDPSRHWTVIKELQVLSSVLENKRLSFAELKRFKCHHEVEGALSRLKGEYGGELGAYEDQPNPSLK